MYNVHQMSSTRTLYTVSGVHSSLESTPIKIRMLIGVDSRLECTPDGIIFICSRHSHHGEYDKADCVCDRSC